MSNEDYLSRFLDDDVVQEECIESLPAWVDTKNSSYRAYCLVLDLVKAKQNYIRTCGSKSKLGKKSTYQISKAEVARLCGVKPQPLFHSASYSIHLNDFLKERNDALKSLVDRKYTKLNGGLRQKSKEELVRTVQAQREHDENNTSKIIDAVYERTVQSLPLDIKKRLELI
ncbi:hypothetical protein [Microbulbifer sp. HZ11]|uniref:hypothetical protein n=1 Tax=Microbulbifer sp. HZ11 TaxID=1453501 RepID=UPI0005BB935F|nr:hypothetical protein [Microbulbifer sp. HZ11]